MSNNPFEKFGIDHLSPSSLNLFSASPAMWVLERLLGHKQSPGAPMLGGKAVEAGVVAGLTGHMKVNECVEVAQDAFNTELLMAKFTGNGDPRAAKWRDALPGMVKQGLDQLLPYGIPSSTQGKVAHFADGLAVPIIGFYDLIYDELGVVVDIKATMYMPTSSSGDNDNGAANDNKTYQIKLAHARQVAFYKHAISDNYDGRICYLTPKKSVVLPVGDSRLHRDALVQIARILQRFLALSDDKQELAQLVCPDFDSFYFNDARARRAALGVWGF